MGACASISSPVVPESKEENKQLTLEESAKEWTRDRVKLLKKSFKEVSAEIPGNKKNERWNEIALRVGGGFSPKECQKKYQELRERKHQEKREQQLELLPCICSKDEFMQAMQEYKAGLDTKRLEITLFAFQDPKSSSSGGSVEIISADLQERGFVDFFSRSAGGTGVSFCSGMCVSLEVKQGKPEIGIIEAKGALEKGGSSSDNGRVFSVRLSSGEVLERVQESDLEVCLNLDLTKGTVQRDYLQTLAEIIGLPNDPTGEKWRGQVVLVIKEAWVQRGFLSSMDDPEYEEELEEAPWGKSFEAWCEQKSQMIAQFAKYGGNGRVLCTRTRTRKGTLQLQLKAHLPTSQVNPG